MKKTLKMIYDEEGGALTEEATGKQVEHYSHFLKGIVVGENPNEYLLKPIPLRYVDSMYNALKKEKGIPEDFACWAIDDEKFDKAEPEIEPKSDSLKELYVEVDE